MPCRRQHDSPLDRGHDDGAPGASTPVHRGSDRGVQGDRVRRREVDLSGPRAQRRSESLAGTGEQGRGTPGLGVQAPGIRPSVVDRLEEGLPCQRVETSVASGVEVDTVGRENRVGAHHATVDRSHQARRAELVTERRRVLVTDGNGRFLTLPRRAWCLVGRQGAIRFELSRTKVLGVALFWVKPGRVVKGHPLRSERPTSSRRTIGRLAGAATLVSLAVSGCAPEAQRGFLPGYSDGPTTNQTDTITNMWVGSWTAALVVGVITWALMLWCVVVYRKRRDDNVLPIQTRYHLPLEIMYTMVPIVMVGVLFFFTQRDMSDIRDTSAVPDLTVQVIGKQWSWDFNYLDEGVYETGQHAIEPGTITGDLGGVGTDESFPTLYLPVGQNVEFQIESRDVIHSFWIPAFLDKMDMVPYRTNIWQVTPLREGVYAGKCAELCGDFHSGMLFNVKVVSVEEFDAEMERLADIGQTGQLGLDLNRQQHPESTATTESDN